MSEICKHRNCQLDLKSRHGRPEGHWFHKVDWPSPGKDCQVVNSAVLILPAQHPVALVPAQMSETLWAPPQWRRVAGNAGIGVRATRDEHVEQHNILRRKCANSARRCSDRTWSVIEDVTLPLLGDLHMDLVVALIQPGQKLRRKRACHGPLSRTSKTKMPPMCALGRLREKRSRTCRHLPGQKPPGYHIHYIVQPWLR